jgi:glucose/arabinose dehydrogenase
LLGLAFHPNYEANGRLFIYYTADGNRDPNVVAEYERSSENPDVANSEEVRHLVSVPDTQSNHNGGMITFGPEGYLYAGLGDGGGGCDNGGQHAPDGNGQTVTNLFGSLLRLDVDAPDRDFAAPDNPFVGREGKDQIWAYGLRNPWRFSVDRKTGDLYIGDVGQNAIEEIDVLPAESEGGQNYGWRGYEGTETADISGCSAEVASEIDDHVPPIYEYRQNTTEGVTIRGGESVTGGYVYRGDAIPRLRGYYLYGDYSSDDIAALRYCEGGVVQNTRLPGLEGRGGGLGSFGEDNAGELYLVYIDTADVLKLVGK